MNVYWRIVVVAAVASVAFAAGRRSAGSGAGTVAVETSGDSSGPRRGARETGTIADRHGPSEPSAVPSPTKPDVRAGVSAPDSGEPGPSPEGHGTDPAHSAHDESDGDPGAREEFPEIEDGETGDNAPHQNEDRNLPGTDAEKIAALQSLAGFRRSQSANGQAPIPDELKAYLENARLSDADMETAEAGDTGPGTEGDPPNDGSDGAGEGGEDDGFRDTVNLLTQALQDRSPDVRDAAFEAVLDLPDEERNLLSLQILGNDDDFLKSELVKSASSAKDEFSVSVLMQALDDGGEGVSGIAAKRLEELFGRTFETTADAMDWWEANRNNYEFPGSDMEPLDSGAMDGWESNR